MAILGFEIDEIVRLIHMVEESGLDEIVIKEESRFLRVRGPRQVVPEAVRAGRTRHYSPQPQRSLPPPEPEVNENQVILESPMMGMFYRAEKPGGPPLVSVGQAVAVGQPIGIIEAMKIFSEVLAEHAGVVVTIPAVDGELVHAGSALIVLRKE